MRQSAAQSRHQLLPARGARGACKWRVSAGSRCSDVAHSSPASASSVCNLDPRLGNQQRPSRHERPPTQTRPFGSVSALVAAVFGPAVGSAAPMSVAVNGADLQLHWQYVRRSRVHGDQRSCTCGMLAAQVLIATADRRVMSRPRVRQSAAPSRHQLLPARGARGACKWRVSAGRRCSDVAHSSPASASSVLDLKPRLRSSVLSTKRASRASVSGGDELRATCSCSGRYRSQLCWR